MNDQQRAAMQMALEALKKCSEQLTRLGYSANHADAAIPTVREALAQPQGEWVDLLAAFESVWLWMENQADGQSKGGHATFDLMMLREQRDIAHAAISKFKEKNTTPVVPQGEPVAVLDITYGREPEASTTLFAEALPEGTHMLYTTPLSVEAAVEATKEKAIAALQGVATGRLDVVEAIRSMK